MNNYDVELMKAPSLMPIGANVSDYECVICHKPATNAHHVVYRSHGGTNGAVVPVCGIGNMTGCHGLIHKKKIYFRYTNRWEYFFNFGGISYGEAIKQEGWREVHHGRV